jgi:hypothetical protein
MARRVKIAAVGVRPPTAESRILERGSMLDLVLHHIVRELEPAFAWRPDLVLLPEACDRPLDLPDSESRRWDRENGPAVQDALARIARERGCVIAYGRGTGSLIVIERDGTVAGRHDLLPGGPPPLVSCSLGKLACILSDEMQSERLRDVYSRLHPDIILLASRFPGGVLERAWAFDCRAHLASAVLWRSDLRLPCRIVSPVGAVVDASTTSRSHARAVINLDSAVIHLDNHREKLLALEGADPDGIAVQDPGYLWGVLVSNEAAGGTIRDKLARAGIETIDQYFTRYLSERDRSLARGAPREGTA